MDLTEEDLELLDPHPDIHALFMHYNALYFESQLGACSVEWSSARMTLCGGVCEWRPGGGCHIKLSEPLLKLRPSRDLKMVLLHEMIHAHMMLRGIRDDDLSGHGTAFKSIMARINTSAAPDHQRPAGGYGITTTHSMFAEVDHYRLHHWRCERCGSLVKRAMNRPPQEADCRGRAGRGADCRDTACRWHMHLKHCGGAWIKIHEPEGYQQKKKGIGKKGRRADGSSENGSRGSGSASEVPAKRPRKADKQGAAASAAAAGGRPITDFFPRTGPISPVAAVAAAGGVLPALQAVARAVLAGVGRHRQRREQRSQLQEQRQQLPAEPTSEERRRLLAEAAMRRTGGEGGGIISTAQQQKEQGQQKQKQQHERPAPPQQQAAQHHVQTEVQPPQGLAPSGAASLAPSPGIVHSAGGSSSDDHEHAAARRSNTAPKAGACDAGTSSSGGSLECPICRRLWQAGELSNAQLNKHVDECLNSPYLAEEGGSGAPQLVCSGSQRCHAGRCRAEPGYPTKCSTSSTGRGRCSATGEANQRHQAAVKRVQQFLDSFTVWLPRERTTPVRGVSLSLHSQPGSWVYRSWPDAEAVQQGPEAFAAANAGCLQHLSLHIDGGRMDVDAGISATIGQLTSLELRGAVRLTASLSPLTALCSLLAAELAVPRVVALPASRTNLTINARHNGPLPPWVCTAIIPVSRAAAGALLCSPFPVRGLLPAEHPQQPDLSLWFAGVAGVALQLLAAASPLTNVQRLELYGASCPSNRDMPWYASPEVHFWENYCEGQEEEAESAAAEAAATAAAVGALTQLTALVIEDDENLLPPAQPVSFARLACLFLGTVAAQPAQPQHRLGPAAAQRRQILEPADNAH